MQKLEGDALFNKRQACGLHWWTGHSTSGNIDPPWEKNTHQASMEGETEEEEETSLTFRCTVRNVRGDGMCFFRAFVASLTRNDGEMRVRGVLQLPAYSEEDAVEAFGRLIGEIQSRAESDVLATEIRGFKNHDEEGLGGNIDIFMIIARLFNTNINVFSMTRARADNQRASQPVPKWTHFTPSTIIHTENRWGPSIVSAIDKYPTDERRFDVSVYTTNGIHYKELVAGPRVIFNCRWCYRPKDGRDHSGCGSHMHAR
jgi:hypothetical protein